MDPARGGISLRSVGHNTWGKGLSLSWFFWFVFKNLLQSENSNISVWNPSGCWEFIYEVFRTEPVAQTRHQVRVINLDDFFKQC